MSINPASRFGTLGHAALYNEKKNTNKKDTVTFLQITSRDVPLSHLNVNILSRYVWGLCPNVPFERLMSHGGVR